MLVQALFEVALEGSIHGDAAEGCFTLVNGRGGLSRLFLRKQYSVISSEGRGLGCSGGDVMIKGALFVGWLFLGFAFDVVDAVSASALS